MSYFTGTVMGVSGTVSRYVVKDGSDVVMGVVRELDPHYDGCDKELVTEYDSRFFSEWKRSGKGKCRVGTGVREKNVVKDVKMSVVHLGCCCGKGKESGDE